MDKIINNLKKYRVYRPNIGSILYCHLDYAPKCKRLKNIYMMKGVDVSSIDSSTAEVKKRIDEIKAQLQRPLYKLDRKGN